MGRGRATSSSSSIDSTNHFAFSTTGASSSSSSQRDLSTDLRLGLGFSVSPPYAREEQPSEWQPMKAEEEYECNSSTLFVKVYMVGIPIGRKVDLLAHESYYDLIRTLEHMFHTNIIWAEAEVDGENYEKYHVLTYADKEGDWMMVGDVPWEMFLSAVRRLKISKCSKF